MVRLVILASILLGTCTRGVRSDLLGFVSAKGEDCVRHINGSVGVKPECIGAPDEQTIQCPLWDNISTARTSHVGFPVAVDFSNPSSDEVSMYWISDLGEEIFQKTILPWQTMIQDTFMGHVFRIKSSSGRTLLEHTVGLIPLGDAVQLDAVGISTPNSKPQTDKDVSLEVGFVNRADSVLKLFFYDPASGDLQLVAHIEPNSAYPQQTFKGHEFRAYSHDRLVASVRIGSDIIVPSCVDAGVLDTMTHEPSSGNLTTTAHEVSDQPSVDINVGVVEPRVDLNVGNVEPSVDLNVGDVEPIVDLNVGDVELVNSTEGSIRARRLKIRGYEDNAKETLQVKGMLKIRRFSSREEL